MAEAPGPAPEPAEDDAPPPSEGEPPFAPTLLGALLGVAVAAHDAAARATTTKTFALGVVALAGLAFVLPRRWRAPAVSAPTVAWSLLAGWLAVSLAWADHDDASVVAAPLLAAVAAHLGGALRRLRDHLATMAAVALAVSALWLALGEPTAGHGNANWLGLTAAVLVPLTLDGAWRAEDSTRWVLGATAVVGVGLLVLARSRAAALGLVGAGLVLAPGRWRLLAGAPLALVLWWRDDLATAWSGRLRLWGDAWAGTSLPLGAGAGRGVHALMGAQGERLQGVPVDVAAQQFVSVHTAHHDLLQVLGEGGLVAVALLLLALGATIWQLRSHHPAGAFAAATVAVAGLGDAPLTLPAVALVAGLLAGAAPPLVRARPKADRLRTLLVAVMLVASLPTWSRRWLAHRELTAWQQSPRMRLADVEAIAALAPEDGEIALAHASALLNDKRTGDALVALDVARRRLPGLAPQLAVGDAHLALGDPHAAALAYQRALALNPASFRASLALARAQRSRGDLEAARAALAVATEVRPNDPDLLELQETLRREAIDRATE